MAFVIDDILGGVIKHQQLMKMRARPRFETTEYAKYLQGVGQKGTVDVQGKLGQYAGDVYNQAANVRSQYLSSARKRMGTSGSIAFERGAAEPGMQAAELVGRERMNLESMNEESRRRAQEAYATSASDWSEKRRQEQQNIQQLREQNSTGSLISAGTSVLGLAAGGALGYFGNKAAATGLGMTGKAVKGAAMTGLKRGLITGAAQGIPGVLAMAAQRYKTPEEEQAITYASEDRDLERKYKQAQIDKMISEANNPKLSAEELSDRDMDSILQLTPKKQESFFDQIIADDPEEAAKIHTKFLSYKRRIGGY